MLRRSGTSPAIDSFFGHSRSSNFKRNHLVKNSVTLCSLLLPLLFACSESSNSTPSQGTTGQVNFSTQVYVASEESDELFVIDVAPNPPVAIGLVDTKVASGEVNANHMAIVSGDGRKVYVTATHQDTVVVVDRATMSVIKMIPVGHHPSHGSVRRGFGELWIVNEESNSISVIDTATDTVTRTITAPSIVVPHHVRWDPTNTVAFVPNIGGNQITVIDAMSYTVKNPIVSAGLTEGACAADPCGFADAQVDPSGLLYAAHISTGQVLVYDTVTETRLADFAVGALPWVAFVDLFGGQTSSHYLVPNFGDASLSRVNSTQLLVTDTLAEGDSETYGINYSPLAPDMAFVMNRNRKEVTVIDVVTGLVASRIDMGGAVETACTTDDGKYLIAPISDLGAVSVIDVQTRSEVVRFNGIGTYPWTSATLGGQNYCH